MMCAVTWPSWSNSTWNASSPRSGCPGSVPYANPNRVGVDVMYTMRHGATSIRGPMLRLATTVPPVFERSVRRGDGDASMAVSLPQADRLFRSLPRLFTSADRQENPIVAVAGGQLIAARPPRLGVGDLAADCVLQHLGQEPASVSCPRQS